MRAAVARGVLVSLMLTASTLSAAVLDAAFTTRTPSADCVPGAPFTSFLTTDQEVWVYVSIRNGVRGDLLTVHWIRPGGSLYQISNFTPLSGPGDWCFDGSLVIRDNAAAQYTGTWTVEGYYNGARIFSTNFSLSEPGGGGGNCDYSVNPLSGAIGAAGGSGQVQVTTDAGCAWTAVSNAPWISITAGASGTGSGSVRYTVAANLTPAQRTGTVTVAGKTYTVTQAGAPAQNQPQISEGGVVNAASYTPATLDAGAIAQGSFFSIFGTNLGPATPQSQMSYPLPEALAEVTVTVRKGAVSVQAYLVFVSAAQINAILPSGAPIGEVEVVVTYRGVASAAAGVRVAAANFGIFTTAAGRGPGIIQNYISATELPLNSRAAPAKPGQVEILLGTGLGAIGAPDNQTPPVGDLPAPVEVLIGGRTAQVLYKGRLPGVAGVDQINFVVPSDAPLGCYVPVQIKVTGAFSNTVTMAIGSTGEPCQDPANPFSSLAATGGKGGEILLIRARVKAQLEAGGPAADLLLDLGLAQFQEFPAGGDLGFNPLLSFPPVGSCTAYSGAVDLTTLLGGDIGGATSGGTAFLGRALDAGPSLQVSGPGGMLPLEKADAEGLPGSYVGILGGAIPIEGVESMPPFLDPGSFRITGSGGADVGPFSADVTIGTPITWTNADATTVIHRDAPLTLTWSGGGSSGLVIVAGLGADQSTGAAGGFFCFVPAEPGAFTVPAAMLSNLPAGAEALGAVIVGDVPVANFATFHASGIDNGIVLNATLNINTVAVQ